MHAFDRQTDRQTEFPLLYRDCIPCSAVKSDFEVNLKPTTCNQNNLTRLCAETADLFIDVRNETGVFTALHEMQTRSCDEISVCLSGRHFNIATRLWSFVVHFKNVEMGIDPDMSVAAP